MLGYAAIQVPASARFHLNQVKSDLMDAVPKGAPFDEAVKRMGDKLRELSNTLIPTLTQERYVPQEGEAWTGRPLGLPKRTACQLCYLMLREGGKRCTPARRV